VFSVEENVPNCQSDDVLKSPYSLLHCPKVSDVCARSDGLFHGPVYPSLMALWQVNFKIPADVKKSLPFPSGPLMLKVEAEICYRQSGQGRELKEKRASGACCIDSKQYLDKDQNCQNCPSASFPRLNGYFCESCPKGFEPANAGNRGYGCKPCEVNKFKAEEGDASCVPCESGKVTNDAKGSSFCVQPE